jgi:hypothetical protein
MITDRRPMAGGSCVLRECLGLDEYRARSSEWSGQRRVRTQRSCCPVDARAGWHDENSRTKLQNVLEDNPAMPSGYLRSALEWAT